MYIGMSNLSSFWASADFDVWEVLDDERFLCFLEWWCFYFLASIYKDKIQLLLRSLPGGALRTSYVLTWLISTKTLWVKYCNCLYFVTRQQRCLACCHVTPGTPRFHPPLILENYVESFNSLIPGCIRSSFPFIVQEAFISVECEVQRPRGRGLCSVFCPVLHWNKAVISECKIHQVGCLDPDISSCLCWGLCGSTVADKTQPEIYFQKQKMAWVCSTHSSNYFILLKPDKLLRIEFKVAPSLQFPTLLISLNGCPGLVWESSSRAKEIREKELKCICTVRRGYTC